MRKWIELSDKKLKKPILRVGDFQKKTDGTKFSFTREHLDYFANSFSNKIPVPLEHTTDPDMNRGWCVGMEVEGDVLNGIFELSDLIKDPNIFDTSVYIPVEDGRVQPIEHVALTSYPVVDGLGKFEAIACSLLPQKEEKVVAVNWASLRTTLELSEDLTEENVVEVLTKRFKDMSEQTKALELSNAKLKESVAPPPINIEQIKDKKIFKLAKDSRKTKIESLPLSKAVCDKLVEIYCTDAGIALALSESAEDNFDTVVAALEQNEPLEFKERSGIQLSDPKKGKEESGLIKDAKRRAELAKKR